MSTLISLQNLNLSYPHKLLFKSASLNINRGEKIGVLGLNGHGKSTIFKLISGLVSADKSVPPFIFDKSKEFSFFHVPQELPELFSWRIEDYFYAFYPVIKKLRQELDQINLKLSEGGDNFDELLLTQEKLFQQLTNLEEDRIESQYKSYLKFFGVTDFQRPMNSLSGGEQRKVALSLGLSAPQELVLWDEPTNHLDLETIEDFESELQASQKTLMIISHDRSLLNNVVDKIVHIQEGKIRSFEGTYEAYLDYLQEEQKRREKELDKLNNHQRQETLWIRRGVQARRTKSKKRIEDYDKLNQLIQDIKSRARGSVSLDLQSSGRKTKLLLSAENLTLRFGERTLFQDLNFSISKGDKIALVGKNGTGKSSLLKLLLGELAPTEGLVKRAHGLDVGYFSQKRESLQDDQTPWGLIGEGIDFVISNTGEKKHVASYLENFLFQSDELKRPIHTFSGGEKNRLQLAQFMKHARDLWIFDEPTNDLDLETIGILEEELRRYEGALIIVGHDRAFINNVTDKCWVLHEGELDKFEAGFAQAQVYLEALYLREKKISTSPLNPSSSEKISNKEKKRYEDLPHEIEQVEKNIEAVQAKLSAFDFSISSKEKNQQLSALQEELHSLEEKRARLYEEWGLLEKRLSK